MKTDQMLAGKWLKEFFDCEVKFFNGTDCDILTDRTVIAFPYAESWRVRIAWLKESTFAGPINVEVSHCPSGRVALIHHFKRWEDAVHLIAESVDPSWD